MTTGVVGTKLTIQARVLPEGATNKDLTWSTSDATTVSLDTEDGPTNSKVVSLKKAGKAKVTATSVADSKKSASVDITVTDPPTLGRLNVTGGWIDNGSSPLSLQNPQSGNTMRYKSTASNAIPTLVYDQVCATTDGWTAVPDNKRVTVADGQVVTVVECTINEAKARSVGSTAVLHNRPSIGELTGITASPVVSGKTTVTFTPAVETGNKVVYKVTDAASKPTVIYDQVCTDGWTELPVDKTIPAAVGQFVTLVEVTADNKARRSGVSAALT